MRIKEIFEDSNKHITFCFGRMNPPTIGHGKLLDTMAAVGGEYQVFVSQTQDKKKNPLSYSEKIHFIKELFPKHAPHVVENDNLNTVMKIASFLYDSDYRHATFVAGSDRLSDMAKLLKTYNGVDGKAHGYYQFETLEFVSSGDREDGGEGVAGVSASNARAAAIEGNLEEFRKATGAGEHTEEMYNAVRAGLGIKEEAAGVGIITKQNTTKDVNKGTIKKNLRKFNL